MACFWRIRRAPGAETALRRFGLMWLVLILTQAGLGAWTVWSNKAADIATLHVVCGALSLAVGTLICIIAFRFNLTSVVAVPRDFWHEKQAVTGEVSQFTETNRSR